MCPLSSHKEKWRKGACVCEKERRKKSIPGLTSIEAPDVAGVDHDKKKVEGTLFIKKRRRENEGRTSLGEEEVVGKVVEGGIKCKRNKREENKGRTSLGEEEVVGRIVEGREKYKRNKRRVERRENEKNKERIYRRGGRALTEFSFLPARSFWILANFCMDLGKFLMQLTDFIRNFSGFGDQIHKIGSFDKEFLEQFIKF